MKYLDPSFSVGPPAKVTCCEKCVYGRGEHAPWCEATPKSPFDADKFFAALHIGLKTYGPKMTRYLNGDYEE